MLELLRRGPALASVFCIVMSLSDISRVLREGRRSAVSPEPEERETRGPWVDELEVGKGSEKVVVVGEVFS